MDYKEKYEQALAKAKEQYNYPCMRSCMGILEEIFPELKESEDEKMRKALIEYFNEQCDMSDWNGVYGYQVVSWLEKPSEKKSLTIDIKSMVDSYEQRLIKNGGVSNSPLVNMCITSFRHGVENTLDELQLKQGKQKPIEMKTAEESLGIDSDTYNKIIDECIFGEQEPAGKVEPKFKVGDKIYLKPEYRMPDDDTPIANTVKEIRRIDDKHYRFDGSYIFIEDQDKYELVEQKLVWSEEDDQYVEDTIALIQRGLSYHTIEKVQKWLKSLRPQNRWKPSERQLACLQDAIEHYHLMGSPATTLNEILKQSKKLKEGKV